jgi:serine/threonine-protein kinase RsbW
VEGIISGKRIFLGRYESLSSIRDFVLQAAQEAGLDRAGAYAIQLAVDEACSNIIDHAYGGENRGEIECETVVRSDGLEVYLSDRGKPFEPLDVPEPDLTRPIEEVVPRGVGFYLMKKMVDELEYHHSAAKGNVMRLFKRKPG